MRKELIATRIRIIEIDPGQVETEFSVVRFYGDKEKADAVYKGVTPLTPEDVAETIVFAAGRPENVVIADMLIFPNHQVSRVLFLVGERGSSTNNVCEGCSNCYASEVVGFCPSGHCTESLSRRGSQYRCRAMIVSFSRLFFFAVLFCRSWRLQYKRILNGLNMPSIALRTGHVNSDFTCCFRFHMRAQLHASFVHCFHLRNSMCT
jgi:hypothetical protein